MILVCSENPAIISEEAVDFAFDVSCLRPDTAAARKFLDLAQKFVEQDVAAVIPRVQILVNFIGLVDCVDGLLDVPETNG